MWHELKCACPRKCTCVRTIILHEYIGIVKVNHPRIFDGINGRECEVRSVQWLLETLGHIYTTYLSRDVKTIAVDEIVYIWRNSGANQSYCINSALAE